MLNLSEKGNYSHIFSRKKNVCWSFFKTSIFTGWHNFMFSVVPKPNEITFFPSQSENAMYIVQSIFMYFCTNGMSISRLINIIILLFFSYLLQLHLPRIKHKPMLLLLKLWGVLRGSFVVALMKNCFISYSLFC